MPNTSKIGTSLQQSTLVIGLSLILVTLLTACASDSPMITPDSDGAGAGPTPGQAALDSTGTPARVVPTQTRSDFGEVRPTSEPVRTPTDTSPETDKEALIALFNSTGGEDWSNSEDWLGFRPISEWVGVTVDANGRIVGLDLSRRRLKHELPPELGNLIYLRTLNLGHNSLAGAIPPELGNLVQLKVLDLTNNELTGEIPPELGNLVNLSTLLLGRNHLNGEIPPELDKLTKLKELSLPGRHYVKRRIEGRSKNVVYELDGCISDLMHDTLVRREIYDVQTCPSSKVSDAEALVALYNATNGPNWQNDENWLTRTPIGEWHGVSTYRDGSVASLDLSGQQLSGEIPPEIGNLTNLQSLNLSRNQLSGELPSELGGLAGLKELYIWGNQFSGCVPGSLQQQLSESDLGRLPFCGSGTAQEGTDRDVLVDVYHAMGGDGWTKATDWMSARPISDWSGVATDGDGRVVGLDLSGHGLEGEIPTELGSLTNLQSLDLGMNQLSGAIPPELGNLTNLITLYLNGNQLSGEIPPELGNLANLERLSLIDNELTGAIPPELGNLTNLITLYLNRNQLSGEIPPQLGSLRALQELWIQDTGLCTPPDKALQEWLETVVRVSVSYCAEITRTPTPAPSTPTPAPSTPMPAPSTPTPAPEQHSSDRAVLVAFYEATGGPNWTNNTNWLSGAPLGQWHGVVVDVNGRVTQINLIDNHLSGEIPPELGNLANLQLLYLGGNQLSGEIPFELGNLANAAQLWLWDNQLSGQIPPELGGLTNLQTLLLDGNQLTGTIPPELGNLSNLIGLSLINNQLSGEIPPELGNLSNLTGLSLGVNQLVGTIPLELGNLSNLILLGLYNNQLSGNVPPELGNLSNLTDLNLRENQLSGEIPPELGNLTNLKALYLSGNQLSGEIPPELVNLSNLTALYLTGNQFAGCIPAELQHAQHHDLTELGLPNCS